MAVKGLQRRKTASEILSERKILALEKIKEAEDFSKKEKKILQQAVVDLNLATKREVLLALSEEWQVKPVDLSQMELDADIVRMIPEAVARRHAVVPFSKEENILYVAMADPKDFFVCEDIQLRTGLEISGVLAMPQDVFAALDKAYGHGDSAAVNRLIEEVANREDLPQADGLELVPEQVKTDITDIDATAPEVEKLVNAIILTALSMKASDIHIEPFEDAMGKSSKILVRYRVDGMLVPGSFNVPWSYRSAIAAKIKIMTNSMNITERRIPQSGRIQILAQGSPIEFRVEMVPTVYGESCVMRILDRKAVQVDIMKMGFLPDTLEKFLGLLKGIGGKKNFGLILVCGPTGSGKSTTLYASLNHVNRPDIKILTAENPVEYNLDGIVQVPVNPDLKLGEDKRFDFATALRSFLRLDPDVIMVGEIRDQETAHIAMEAAMTGHLVFSTIHTNDAASALSRLTDMGIPNFMVVTTLKAVMAQRLSRRLCENCKKAHDPTPEEIQIFKENKVDLPSGTKIYGPAPEGCDKCKSLGFRGRLGLHELLVMTDVMRAFALKEVAADPVRQQAAKEGMRLIIQDGLMKVIAGHTTVREVLEARNSMAKLPEAKSENGQAMTMAAALELFSLAGNLSSVRDLDYMLQKIGAAAEKLLDSEASAIMLLTDDKKNLFFRVASGEKAKALKTMILPLGQGIAGWVAQNQTPEMVNDAKSDPRFAGKFDQTSGFVTRSLLCVPMFFGNELVGVIEVLNKRRGTYSDADTQLLLSLAGLASSAITNVKIISEQKNFSSNMLELLVAVIEAVKPGMEGHPVRAARLACAIARAMGMDNYEYRMVYYAGLLHDVGYVAFRNKKLLSALGVSNVSEEMHPALSVKMLEGIKMLQGALPMIAQHHERLDGTGFPGKLSGGAISLGGRILGLVEAMEELRMTSGLSGQEFIVKAVQEAKAGSKSRFDPKVVNAFVEIVTSQEESW